MAWARDAEPSARRYSKFCSTLKGSEMSALESMSIINGYRSAPSLLASMLIMYSGLLARKPGERPVQFNVSERLEPTCRSILQWLFNTSSCGSIVTGHFKCPSPEAAGPVVVAVRTLSDADGKERVRGVLGRKVSLKTAAVGRVVMG